MPRNIVICPLSVKRWLLSTPWVRRSNGGGHSQALWLYFMKTNLNLSSSRTYTRLTWSLFEMLSTRSICLDARSYGGFFSTYSHLPSQGEEGCPRLPIAKCIWFKYGSTVFAKWNWARSLGTYISIPLVSHRQTLTSKLVFSGNGLEKLNWLKHSKVEIMLATRWSGWIDGLSGPVSTSDFDRPNWRSARLVLKSWL